MRDVWYGSDAGDASTSWYVYGGLPAGIASDGGPIKQEGHEFSGFTRSTMHALIMILSFKLLGGDALNMRSFIHSSPTTNSIVEKAIGAVP